MSQNLQKFVEVMTYGYQEIENALWGVLVERLIDDAVGAQLDGVGRIVGQLRLAGQTDDVYRRFVRARAATSKSSGTIDQLLNITRLVLNDDDVSIETVNYGTASLVQRLHGVVFTDDVLEIAIGFLRDAVAGGVRLILEYLTDLEESFRFPATFATADVDVLDTSITVHDTSLFPAAGSAVIDPDIGTAESGDEEHDTFAYKGKTATTLTGVTGLAGDHLEGAAVIPSGWFGKGFGDESDVSIGGALAGAKN